MATTLRYSHLSIDEIWNYIMDVYNTVVDACIPLGLGSNNTNERWMTRETAIARNKKIEKWTEHRKKENSS